ncbi:MAG: PAS domain S-box protein [Smithellaceae bacterium]|jgi:PAS domain S-box-containing protein|nr:PAS domain S-box protein [Smithellaceae bacterium]MDD3258958.1 PAS domain S-box protein [Smithellaceae bacterium]MDD3848517.1 PAS domain S-box protein [Smithellaceae bacterium]
MGSRENQTRRGAGPEEALRERAGMLESILNGVLLLITYTDKDERYAFVNRAYAEWYHIKPEELIGKRVSEVLKPDVYARAFENIQKALGGERVAYENQVTDPEGRERILSVQYEPHFEGEAVKGFFTSIVDITGQKSAARELKERERVLATMIANLPGFVYRCANDHDWTMTFLSEKCADVTGYTVSDFLQNKINYNDIVHPDYRESLREKWQEAILRKGFFEEEYPVVAASGETRWVWERGRGVFDPAGELLFLEGFIGDITDRKRDEKEKEDLQTQLIQAQRMESIGRLAGGIAHDFNNMLAVILGRADMAMMRMDPAQRLYRDLQEIRKAAERSANLTRQLLAFARKQTVALKVLDLNEMAEGMLKILRRLIGENIDLVWQPGRNLPPVKVDPDQMDQILVNLYVNAKDAIGGVGRIIMKTGAAALDEAFCAVHRGFVPGDYVTLSVSDNGCGMNQETLNRIFEPFFTTKDTGRGTGLGLSTVYGVVKQHGGFINAESEPGRGSTFTVYLPRHLKAGIETAGNKETASVAGTETVLLVEDEPAILEMARMMLQRLGYTVLSAGKPTEAMELARSHTGEIHLLMTDVIMPEMNGRDLALSISFLHPKIRRLFMSGYPANVIARQGVLDEGVHFIQKPFSMKDLAIKLREAIENR